MPGEANLGAALWVAAARSPEQVFLIDRHPTGEHTTWTYSSFFNLVRRYAGGLRAAGAQPGDRVVVQVEKSPEAVALYVACLWAGTVHVPLNPRFTSEEHAYFLSDSDPRVVITDDEIALSEELIATATGVRSWMTLNESGNGSFATWANSITPLDDPIDRSPNDLAAILYTSGTTGQPKGAALSHRNLHDNATALSQAWRFDRSDRLLHALPIFHVHGLFVALHCAMLATSTVLFHRTFHADAVAADLAESTVFMGVPTHYIRLCGSGKLTRTLCAGMRLFTCGSAPLTEDVFARFTELSGHEICERYGMSETGITLSNPYDGPRIPGTVGFALPGVEAQVVDDHQQPVQPGTIGVLAIRSNQTMNEYWGRPDATDAAIFGDRWFLTGDVASMTSDGRVTLQGRTGDMIISGGENVYPKEIEQLLDQLPEVHESAVIGLADHDLGERVVAVLAGPAPSLTVAQVRELLTGKLARFKHPRQVFWVDELPRNAMGKVQKADLRRRYQSVL